MLEAKKACDRKCYKADFESKEDSTKAYYDQHRELILASKQAQYQANPKEKKSYEVGVYRLGAKCPCLFVRNGTIYLLRVFLRVVCELQCLFAFQYAMQAGRWPAGRTIYK